MPSARYPWIPLEIKARAQYKRRSAAGTVQRVGVARAVSRQDGVFLPLMCGPSSRRLTHFVAAALPKFSRCVLKLSDRTSSTGVTRGLVAGCRRARRFSAVTPPVRYGVTRA